MDNREKLEKWAGKLDCIFSILRSIHTAVEAEDPKFDYEGEAIRLGEMVSPEMLNDLSFIKDIYNRTRGA